MKQNQFLEHSIIMAITNQFNNQLTSQLTSQPPKGTYDWFPEEFRIRKYIFDTWRQVCTSFGYEEYLTPVFESAEIYRAKSGEDIGGKELMVFTDKAGRELAIRPEMTPSVTRMVSRIYEGASKPLRLFSIANFVRNEKPQRGRNREFWQLNLDIFGSRLLQSDVEIAQMCAEIMLAFDAPRESFTIFLNNRKLIEFILNQVAQVSAEQKVAVVRILDKSAKLSADEFNSRLVEVGLNAEQIGNLSKFINAGSGADLIAALPEVAADEGYQETMVIIEHLDKLGYEGIFNFRPNVIRGFDYYDGMVLEVFDKHPDNQRALFGGGRYNGLGKLFGVAELPAVGVAPGDETLRLFLESWNLLGKVREQQVERYYAPMLDINSAGALQKLARRLRQEGKVVELGLELQKFNKAFDYANRKHFDYVVILGDQELTQNVYKLKNMTTGEQQDLAL